MCCQIPHKTTSSRKTLVFLTNNMTLNMTNNVTLSVTLNVTLPPLTIAAL